MKPLLIVALLILSGCATTTPPGNTVLYPTVAHPAAPAPVALNNVDWEVVTKSNIDTFAAAAAKTQNTANPVFVIITPDDYKVMLGNLAELKRYIEQQKAIIAYYENATTWPTTPQPAVKVAPQAKFSLKPISH